MQFKYRNSNEPEYIEREREPGYVRPRQKDAWMYLTRKGTDFGNFVRKLNLHLQSVNIKTFLVPAQYPTFLLNPFDPKELQSGIMFINDWLHRKRSQCSISLAILSERRKESPPVKEINDLDDDDLLALSFLLKHPITDKSLTYDSLMDTINRNFLPESIKLLVLHDSRTKRHVVGYHDDPVEIVYRLRAIFEEIGAQYMADLVMAPRPMVRSIVQEKETQTEVA